MSESPIELRGRGGGVVFQGTQSPGGGSQPFGIATARLTDAQIKALPTTPVTLAAAPGPGKQLFPFFAHMAADTTHGVYASVDPAAQLGIIGNLLTSLSEVNAANGTVSGLLGFGGQTEAVFGPNASSAVPADSNIYALYGFTTTPNRPLTTDCTNGGVNFTGGDSRNSLVVTVLYAIVTLA